MKEPEPLEIKIDPDTLGQDALMSMREAALEAVDCVRVLTKGGGNLVGEVLRGNGDFTEWEHYPPDDIFDPESHAQYYFHAHPPEGRTRPDYGHFHTFLRAEGMPKGVKPAAGQSKTGTSDDLCHLIAISMTREGLPERLFTTNRWVTAETWYRAEDAIRALDRFVIDLAYPSWPLNRWISAMMVLFRPQIIELLRARDQVVEAWAVEHPGEDVHEDRRLEVTSQTGISLFDQIQWLDDVFEGQGA